MPKFDASLVRKVGRPAKMADGRNRTVYLDNETFGLAKVIGGGSASAGLREAVDHYVAAMANKKAKSKGATNENH
jgi:hypothetical protein